MPDAPQNQPQEPKNEKLKLRAKDHDDLVVISTFLQDALVPLAGMHYDPKNKEFNLTGHRFCWEHTPHPEEGKKTHKRTQSFLNFKSVAEVHTKGIENTSCPHTTLSLISVVHENDHIHMTFSGGAAVRLKVEEIDAQLGDGHIDWPTTFVPTHT